MLGCRRLSHRHGAVAGRDGSGVAASLEMVEQADLYLGIYASRYGWVPAGHDRAITELEFDRAVARQGAGQLREIVIFTAHESHPWTAKDFEAEAGAQEKLRLFKTRAATGRVRREFESAEELRRLVLHPLTDFKNRHAPAVRSPKRQQAVAVQGGRAAGSARGPAAGGWGTTL